MPGSGEGLGDCRGSWSLPTRSCPVWLVRKQSRQNSWLDSFKKALDYHGQHGDERCPVCGSGTLDTDWRLSTLEQVARLQESARRYREAKEKFDRTIRAARSLVAVPSIPVSDAVDTLRPPRCLDPLEVPT